MGIILKSCVLSLSALVALAARADTGAGSTGQDDPAYHHAESMQTDGDAAPETSAQAADPMAQRAPQQAMSARDAAEGSGSGEPRRDGEARWNQQEFLRNVWTAP